MKLPSSFQTQLLSDTFPQWWAFSIKDTTAPGDSRYSCQIIGTMTGLALPESMVMAEVVSLGDFHDPDIWSRHLSIALEDITGLFLNDYEADASRGEVPGGIYIRAILTNTGDLPNQHTSAIAFLTKVV